MARCSSSRPRLSRSSQIIVQLRVGENAPPQEPSQSFKKLEKPGTTLHFRGYVWAQGRQILRKELTNLVQDWALPQEWKWGLSQQKEAQMQQLTNSKLSSPH